MERKSARIHRAVLHASSLAGGNNRKKRYFSSNLIPKTARCDMIISTTNNEDD